MLLFGQCYWSMPYSGVIGQNASVLHFHLFDHRPNWILRGSSAITEKGEIDCNKIMKIKPTLLTIAVAKKAHKKKKKTKNQKQN